VRSKVIHTADGSIGISDCFQIETDFGLVFALQTENLPSGLFITVDLLTSCCHEFVNSREDGTLFSSQCEHCSEKIPSVTKYFLESVSSIESIERMLLEWCGLHVNPLTAVVKASELAQEVYDFARANSQEISAHLTEEL
jgi:hypothetical protein